MPHLGETSRAQATQLVGNVEVAEEGVAGERGRTRLRRAATARASMGARIAAEVVEGESCRLKPHADSPSSSALATSGQNTGHKIGR